MSRLREAARELVEAQRQECPGTERCLCCGNEWPDHDEACVVQQVIAALEEPDETRVLLMKAQAWIEAVSDDLGVAYGRKKLLAEIDAALARRKDDGT